MIFETDKGQQAQLDWKENINFVLSNGEVININIFVLILSYSRFRVYRLSLEKTQDVVFSFLNESFEAFGGVPKELLTDKNEYDRMSKSSNPYGDGLASKYIVDAIIDKFN